MSTDLSTDGTVDRGAAVLVASGIISVVAGQFPFSSLAGGAAPAADGTPSLAA